MTQPTRRNGGTFETSTSPTPLHHHKQQQQQIIACKHNQGRIIIKKNTKEANLRQKTSNTYNATNTQLIIKVIYLITRPSPHTHTYTLIRTFSQRVSS